MNPIPRSLAAVLIAAFASMVAAAPFDGGTTAWAGAPVPCREWSRSMM